MNVVTRPIVAAFLVAFATGAEAQVVDKYHITPDEKAACQEDATLLCSNTGVSDEDSLIACMKENRAKLSPVCLKTFKAGMAKRHMT